MASNLELSSTSAFVLLLSDGQVHTSDATKKFLKLLDLESARPFAQKCNNFWPHYSEVIKNRKTCIYNLARQTVAEKVEQIVIFGAGFDTLSLEAATWNDTTRIFEIDTDNMDAKTHLIDLVDASLAQRISCITADMRSPDALIPALLQQGWRSDVPSLLIFEGISYYLKKQILWGIIGKFASGKNRVILEYLLPDSRIQKDIIPIARYPFDLITTETHLDHAVTYDISMIASKVKSLGSRILQHYTMQQMEKQRTLQNKIFTPRMCGWIEICMFCI